MPVKEIYVSNDGIGREEVLDYVGEYAYQKGLSYKERIHIRLLAEEMLGMVKEIAGKFCAFFHIEEEENKYKLCLEARTDMDPAKRDLLIDVSSSGKNAAAKGVMSKLKEIFSVMVMSVRDKRNYSCNNVFMYGSGSFETFGSNNVWSLSRYRSQIAEKKSESEEVDNDWDELERSIIANLADDVTVGIKDDNVYMVITKEIK